MNWSEPAYEALTRLVAQHAGLEFRPGHHAHAEAAIRRAMARRGVAGAAEYLERLQGGRLPLDDLVGELTVGETYFFRDPAQFEVIRRHALPELLRLRAARHVLRAWSAGCASGEEAYSLAMLLEEEGLGARSRILATDISPQALARARAGRYGEWSLRGDGARQARRHLHRSGTLYEVDATLRERVRFELLNLARDACPSVAGGTWGMDLILCRNVLIYFDRQTVRHVVSCLHECLVEGGWLVTAPTDPPLAELAPFETVTTPAGLLYRRSAGLARSRQAAEAARAASTRQRPPPRRSTLAAAEPDTAVHVPPQRQRNGRPQAGAEPAEKARRREASGALAAGQAVRALELTRTPGGDPAAAALRIRALTSLGAAGEALDEAAAAAARHRLSVELQFLHATLLLADGRDEQARAALRRTIYLEPELAIAHFALGSALWRAGDAAAARREYRTARALAAARPPDEALPLADGESAGRLAEAAAACLEMLNAAEEDPR